jgi:hypothetical protein
MAANLPVATCPRERLNQLVTNTLMVPLTRVVGHELGNRAPKMGLPQNHVLQTLFLDRPDEPLCVGIAVGCPERRPNDPDSLVFEKRQHRMIPLSVAIANQHGPICQDAVDGIVKWRIACTTNASSGYGAKIYSCTNALERHRAGVESNEEHFDVILAGVAQAVRVAAVEVTHVPIRCDTAYGFPISR